MKPATTAEHVLNAPSGTFTTRLVLCALSTVLLLTPTVFPAQPLSTAAAAAPILRSAPTARHVTLGVLTAIALLAPHPQHALNALLASHSSTTLARGPSAPFKTA